MRKNKRFFQKRKPIRPLLVLVIVQGMIVLLFVSMLNQAYPVDSRDRKRVDIIVDDIYYYRCFSEDRVRISFDSTQYTFNSPATVEEYSCYELYKNISVGDRMTLHYYENKSLFGDRNIVVGAHTETETYRSIEAYNKGKEGLAVVVFIIFLLIELVFCAIAILYICVTRGRFA